MLMSFVGEIGRKANTGLVISPTKLMSIQTVMLELGGVRKRPAESGIGFCLAPARAWLYPAPFPASLSVRHSFELAAP